MSDPDTQFFYLNPLLEFNFRTSRVTLNPAKWEGLVDYILQRHPVYHEKLKRTDGFVLNDTLLKICFLVQHRYSHGQMERKLDIKADELLSLVRTGIDQELFRVYPLKNRSNFLQFYHTDQQIKTEPDKKTFSNLWKASVDSYGNQVLLRSERDESEFTYADVNGVVLKIAGTLKQAGVKPGNRIIFFSTLTEEFLLCCWGSWLAGCVVVPVNPMLSLPEKNEIIKRIQPELIFFEPEFLVSDGIEFNHEKMIAFSDHSETLADAVLLSDWIQDCSAPDFLSSVQIRKDDVACILFTSGTTSKSKAVVLSHEAMFNSSFELADLFNWQSEDIILNLGDSFTMSGLRNPAWAVLQNGSSVLIVPAENKKFTQKIAEDIAAWKATVLGTVPEMVRMLTEIENPKLLNSVKQVICTGSFLSESVKTKFEKQFQKPVLNYYGLTETCGLCAGHRFEDQAGSNESIGKTVDSVIQIVNEAGDILPHKTVGLLRVFSTNLMQGYLDDHEAMAQILHNGWLYTGDLAETDENGFIFLKGRNRDIIKLKDGNLVYPDLIENCILHNSLISEVAVTSVFLQDDKEKMIAFVRPKSEKLTDDLVYNLKVQILQELGALFVPELWVEATELPKGVNGKFLKRNLSEKYESVFKK